MSAARRTLRYVGSEPRPTSPRGYAVAHAFGLDVDAFHGGAPRSDGAVRAYAQPHSAGSLMPPGPGLLMFLGGASGSGKSSLLRRLCRAARRRSRVIQLARVPLADRPVVDLFPEAEPLINAKSAKGENDAHVDSSDLSNLEIGPLGPGLSDALRRLSAVGLSEVWTWLRRPAQLSEGQRWRLRLAIALQGAEASDRPVLLVCDEFAAALDRVSAAIVSRCLRRAVDAHPEHLAVLLASSHDDLYRALDPDVRVDCDFGEYHVTTCRRRSARDRGEP